MTKIEMDKILEILEKNVVDDEYWPIQDGGKMKDAMQHLKSIVNYHEIINEAIKYK